MFCICDEHSVDTLVFYLLLSSAYPASMLCNCSLQCPTSKQAEGMQEVGKGHS